MAYDQKSHHYQIGGDKTAIPCTAVPPTSAVREELAGLPHTSNLMCMTNLCLF